MRLIEQLYRKLNKLYYHGQPYKYRDESLVEFSNCYYLSSDPYYAFNYSGQNGYIKVLRLKKDLNLCNFNSKQDRQILETYIRKHDIDLTTKDIDNLRKKDWLDVFNGIDSREIFLDLLKYLRYDGFFNFENTADFSKFYVKQDRLGFPAIGIFDISNLIEVETLHGRNEFLKLDRIKNVFEGEQNFLKRNLYKLYNLKGRLTTENVNNLLSNNSIRYYLDLLDDNDILQILNNFKPEEIKEDLKQEKRIIKQHFKDWWGYEPSDEDLANKRG